MGQGSLHLRGAVMAKPDVEAPGGSPSPEIVEQEMPLFDSPFRHVLAVRIELRKDKNDQIKPVVRLKRLERPKRFNRGDAPINPQRGGKIGKERVLDIGADAAMPVIA